jgi:transcriptional regulator with XRE-family HTH domain
LGHNLWFGGNGVGVGGLRLILAVPFHQGAAFAAARNASPKMLIGTPEENRGGSEAGIFGRPAERFFHCAICSASHLAPRLLSPAIKMSTCKLSWTIKTQPVPKPLTIRSFLPQREIEICQRLREIRQRRRLEQPEFAEALGITRSRLSSYEYAKAPIKYELGKQSCYRFNVNQRWFATGAPPAAPYFDISPNLEFRIKTKDLFSTAFDSVLRPYIEERERELKQFCGEEIFYAGEVAGEALDNFHLIGENPAKAAAFYVRKAVLIRLQWLPPDLQIEYADAIMGADRTFQKKFGKVLAALLPPADRGMDQNQAARRGKESLTEISLKSKTADMKSEMQKLLHKVKAKASRPGGKSQLANELGVAPARVSEWLAGKKEPGGEYTLRLLKWVES